jgi:hypothetical protein
MGLGLSNHLSHRNAAGHTELKVLTYSRNCSAPTADQFSSFLFAFVRLFSLSTFLPPGHSSSECGRGGVQEKRFKSGEQWEVLRRRRELSSSERTASRSSCHSTRHGVSVCSSERKSALQSATESDSRKTSNTAGKSSSITSSGSWSASMRARSYSIKARLFALVPLCTSTRGSSAGCRHQASDFLLGSSSIWPRRTEP